MSTVTIVLDEATPLLRNVESEAEARGLALVGARAVGILVKDHLYGLDAQRHRYGNHFYRQAGDSVSTGAVPQGAAVSITQQGFRQRLQGGTIRARNARNLTLPEAPEAHGKRAGEFNDLDFTFAHNPKTDALQPALVRRPSTAIRYRKHTRDGVTTYKAQPVASLLSVVMFWLTPSVEQKPDPSVLPPATGPKSMGEAATTAIQRRFMRLRSRIQKPDSAAS